VSVLKAPVDQNLLSFEKELERYDQWLEREIEH
jgi:hypothetical protein